MADYGYLTTFEKSKCLPSRQKELPRNQLALTLKNGFFATGQVIAFENDLPRWRNLFGYQTFASWLHLTDL